MNRLEIALLDPTNDQLDLYLEIASNMEVRADIEDIRKKAANSQPSGQVLEALRGLLKKWE